MASVNYQAQVWAFAPSLPVGTGQRMPRPPREAALFIPAAAVFARRAPRPIAAWSPLQTSSVKHVQRGLNRLLSIFYSGK
jgi:hypothetical protein